MAKSSRSKRVMRKNVAKRKVLDNSAHSEECRRQNSRVLRLQDSQMIDFPRKKNFFLHPEDPDSEIPQVAVLSKVDFRPENVPVMFYNKQAKRRFKEVV